MILLLLNVILIERLQIAFILFYLFLFTNDPSAGSPTETLLRLHLPLSDEVYIIFH